MSRLPDAFHQDKALRDAARDVLIADMEHAKATISGKALAGRVAGRVGDGAKDVLEVAKGHASDRKGILAGIIAIIALWFARGTIAEILGFGSSSDEASEELDGEEGLADNKTDTQDREIIEEPQVPDEPEADTQKTGEPEVENLEPLITGDTV